MAMEEIEEHVAHGGDSTKILDLPEGTAKTPSNNSLTFEKDNTRLRSHGYTDRK